MVKGVWAVLWLAEELPEDNCFCTALPSKEQTGRGKAYTVP